MRAYCRLGQDASLCFYCSSEASLIFRPCNGLNRCDKGMQGQSGVFACLLHRKQNALTRSVVQVAVLRSAVKMEQEQQFLIAKKLQELTGSKNIKLKPVVDPELIAGFVVEYSSAQIDLSVKGKLDRISLEMQGALA